MRQTTSKRGTERVFLIEKGLDMNRLAAIKHGAVNFGREEEGAQIIEYALIVALASIALGVALSTFATGGGFAAWIGRVTTCLAPGGTCT